MRPTKTIISSTFTIIAIFLNILAGIYVARFLEPKIYGEYAYYLGVYGFVLLFGSLGLTTLVISAVTKRSNPLKNQVDTLFKLRLVTALIIFVMALLTKTAGLSISLTTGLIIGGVNLIRVFLTGMLGGVGLITTSTGLELAQSILYIALLLISSKDPQSINSIYRALFFSQSLTLILAFLVVKQNGLLGLNQLVMKLSEIKEVIKPNFLPLASIYILTLLLASLNPLGNFLLGNSGRLDDAAYINIALTITGVSSLIGGSLLTSVYYPRLCLLINQKQSQSEIKWVDSYFRFFAYLVIMSGTLITYYGRDLIELIYTSKYLPASSATIILAWANIFSFLAFVLAWTFVANHKYSLAIKGAIPQFLVLVSGSYLAITNSSQPLQSISIVYLLSGISGLLSMLWLNRYRRYYSLPLTRVFLGVGLSSGSVLLLHELQEHLFFPNLIALIITAIFAGIITALVFFDQNLVSLARKFFAPSLLK